METVETFGQKFVKWLPLAGALVAVSMFDGGITAVKTAGATIASNLTFGGIAKTAALGAVGYVTVKVLVTPDYNKKMAEMVDDFKKKFFEEVGTKAATAPVAVPAS